MNRGKLIKKVTAASKPDYCFYFDDENLVLSEKYSCEKRYRNFEWIKRAGDYEYAIGLEDEIENENSNVTVTITQYEDKNVMSNKFSMEKYLLTFLT